MDYYNTLTKQIPEDLLSKASKLQWSMPTKTKKEIISSIADESNTWDSSFESAVSDRIDWHIKKRADHARLLVTLPDDVAARHNVREAAELPTLTDADYKGVIVLNLPMGAGKTRKMGVPFIQHAAGKGRAVAIAPLTSLVDQMADVFDAGHYARIAPSDIEVCDRLAVCLPSIIREDHAAIHAEAAYIFIDEILSCLAFLASKQCGGEPQKAFYALVHRIRHARCVMVADANIDAGMIRFLEYCGPDERFLIIRQPMQDTGKCVGYHIGKNALPSCVGEILTRLADGQNLWIATENPETARLITGIIAERGVSVFGIWPKNKGNKAQAAFLHDPETEVVKYRAVVHSPVIQSGLHIADSGQHFDHVVWIGAGGALTADKVMQTLGRVRYAKTFTLGLLQNNQKAAPSAQTLMQGLRMASEAEGLPADSGTVYDRFTASQKARHEFAVSDAHLAIITVLRHARWRVERLQVSYDSELSDEIKAHRDANADLWKAQVIAAPVLSSEDAETLQKQRGLTTAQSAAMEAYTIRKKLGISDITPEKYDFWDGGHVISKLERFNCLIGKPSHPEVDRVALSHQKFPQAVAAAYARLFRGYEIGPDTRLSPDEIRGIMQGITQADAIEYAFLGIIESAPVYRYDRKGNIKLYQAPTDQPGRFWNMVMERIGLAGKRIVNGTTGQQSFGLKSGSWEEIEQAATQRRSNKNSIFSIRDNGVSVAEIEPPQARPIALPVQLIRDVCKRLTVSRPKLPEHTNENYSSKERSARDQVKSIMSRFIGWPNHGFADVWLPVSDEYGFQKTMTVPVPICVTLDETYDCVIETAPGSQEYLAFPFDVEAEPVVSRLSA